MPTDNADANTKNTDPITTACDPVHGQRASSSAVTGSTLLVQCTALGIEDRSYFAIIALPPERLRVWTDQARALRAAHEDFGYSDSTTKSVPPSKRASSCSCRINSHRRKSRCASRM
jgi:hypothetical protein